ncbi:hypothetical protein [Tenacibaculum amylolyticum]|uniref:hypothetical protein n=1 Tax=Tenacibaculum amylolyticum TaxID=104269 RepID=UPI00389542EB
MLESFIKIVTLPNFLLNNILTYIPSFETIIQQQTPRKVPITVRASHSRYKNQ